MLKYFFLFVSCNLVVLHTDAQSAIDKNRVLEYFQGQQFDEAINYLLPALESDSNNLQVLGFLGYANYMNEDIASAKKYYQKIFDLDSNNVEAIQYLASLNSSRDPELAEMLTMRLINLQPDKAVWLRNMGDLLRRKKEKDSALLYYSQAYGMAPNDYRNAAALADVLIDQKQFAEADSILNAAPAKDSLNVSLLKLRVRSAYESKNYEQALIPGERLMRLDEPALNALTQLSLAYYNLKKYNDCIRVCEYMLDHNIDLESVYYYDARAWAKLNNFSRSNELLEICVGKAISKTAEIYYYNLGQNYESLKQFKKAIAQYDTAYYLFKDPAMKYNCGRICESNLKNLKLARKYYSEYLKLADPQSPEEKKAYRFVKLHWGKTR